MPITGAKECFEHADSILREFEARERKRKTEAQLRDFFDYAIERAMKHPGDPNWTMFARWMGGLKNDVREG